MSESLKVRYKNVLAPFVLKDGALSVSPSNFLKTPRIFDDQVLQEYPLLAQFEAEDIKENIGHLIPRGPILEVGCGVGVLIERLRQEGLEAYGVDLDSKYRKNWKERKIDQFCFLGNAENMPGINDGSISLFLTRAFWDSVFGPMGLSRGVNDFKLCFNEIHRVLQPGGVFIPLAEIGHENNLDKLANLNGLTKVVKDVPFKTVYKKVK